MMEAERLQRGFRALRDNLFRYRCYGLTLASEFELDAPPALPGTDRNVEFISAPSELFETARTLHASKASSRSTAWFKYLRLENENEYLCWTGLFEVLIEPEGRTVYCHALSPSAHEFLSTYLLHHVLSCCLLKWDTESLHATVCARNGQAVALLGDCGYGKSTLAAALLAQGFHLVTDDLLVLSRESEANWQAHRGSQRIKLFPDTARAIFGAASCTGVVSLNPDTQKLVLPMSERFCEPRDKTRLIALVALRDPELDLGVNGISLRPLRGAEGFLRLIQNTFNALSDEPVRLASQFRWTRMISDEVPIFELSYPRNYNQLDAVVSVIESKLHV